MVCVGRLALLALLLGSAASVRSEPPPPGEAEQALALLKTLVDIPTEPGRGQVPVLAARLADLFRAGGFAPGDIAIDRFGETAFMTVRYPGDDPTLKPIVVSDHMDVVAADPKDWRRDPFTAVVENGYVYGRGALDNKFDVAMVVTTLLRLKRESYAPRRTIILALSGDEETDMKTSQILAQRLKGAELSLNGDGGGGALDETTGKPSVFALQAGEKTYADFEIAFAGPGGHSSEPGADNAIYRLARAIDRVAAYRFPPRTNALTIAYLTAKGARIGGPLGAAMTRFAANPKDAAAAATISANRNYVGQIRTTCVATMLSGGHALNALPQRAAVNINCRIFPGVRIADIQATLARVVADPAARIAVVGEPAESDASPLRADVVAAVRKAVALRAPGVPVVPEMSAGASDGLYFRAAGVPTYGVSSYFIKPSEDYSHGLDERVPVAAIPGALVHWRSLLTDLSAR